MTGSGGGALGWFTPDYMELGAVEDGEEELVVVPELHPASSPANTMALSPAEEIRFHVELLIKDTSSYFLMVCSRILLNLDRFHKSMAPLYGGN